MGALAFMRWSRRSGKVFTDERAGMGRGLNDLKREVEKTSSDPHIVRMGVLERGRRAALSAWNMCGTDLHELKRSAAGSILSWDKVLAYMMQLCDAASPIAAPGAPGYQALIFSMKETETD